jgi:hypothetical protein
MDFTNFGNHPHFGKTMENQWITTIHAYSVGNQNQYIGIIWYNCDQYNPKINQIINPLLVLVLETIPILAFVIPFLNPHLHRLNDLLLGADTRRKPVAGCEPGELMEISWVDDDYPLVNVYITIGNHHFLWENPLKMVIFNSYVKLPEGKSGS